MFQYDYYNESLQFGKDLMGWMVIKVANPDDSDKIAHRIDGMFANSSNETKTATERVFIKQFLEQVGNIGLILVSVTTAVFFTMLLVTANTMAQSVRERTNEIGVLKTLGFSGRIHSHAGAARVAVPHVHGRARRARTGMVLRQGTWGPPSRTTSRCSRSARVHSSSAPR